MDQKRYVAQRKKSLKQLQVLLFQKIELNKKIRFIRDELNAWDKALLNS